MKSSALQSLSFICLCAAGLSSCIVQRKIIVPDMPHDSMWRERARQAALAAGANNAALHPELKQQPTTPATHTEPTTPPAEQPKQPAAPVATPQTPAAAPTTAQPTGTKPATPAVQPSAPAVKPTTTAPAKTTVTQPAKPATPAKPAAPAVTAPAQPAKTTITPAAPSTAPATPTTPAVPTPAKPKPDLSHITNENGYIPYAKPVPGDPTRVFNPLAPELTLRIVNKATGQPYPRDTKLKVPGTNFFFKIP